jgi:hypothetical protein
MTPNRQSPAYELFAQSRLPFGAANSASASSAVYRSKSEDNISTAQGGWPTNFERLRETKDLSAR